MLKVKMLLITRILIAWPFASRNSYSPRQPRCILLTITISEVRRAKAGPLKPIY